MQENWDVYDDVRQELLLWQVQEHELEQGQWTVSMVLHMRYHIGVDL